MDLVLGQHILEGDSCDFCCFSWTITNAGHKRPWSLFSIILSSCIFHGLFVNLEQKTRVLNFFHQASDKCLIRPNFVLFITFWFEEFSVGKERQWIFFWKDSYTCCKLSVPLEGANRNPLHLSFSEVTVTVLARRDVFSVQRMQIPFREFPEVLSIHLATFPSEMNFHLLSCQRGDGELAPNTFEPTLSTLKGKLLL